MCAFLNRRVSESAGFVVLPAEQRLDQFFSAYAKVLGNVFQD